MFTFLRIFKVIQLFIEISSNIRRFYNLSVTKNKLFSNHLDFILIKKLNPVVFYTGHLLMGLNQRDSMNFVTIVVQPYQSFKLKITWFLVGSPKFLGLLLIVFLSKMTALNHFYIAWINSLLYLLILKNKIILFMQDLIMESLMGEVMIWKFQIIVIKISNPFATSDIPTIKALKNNLAPMIASATWLVNQTFKWRK